MRPVEDDIVDPASSRGTGPGSFNQFFADNRDGVLALVFTLSGNRPAAEDLAQDAFADAFRRWDVIGAYDDPGAWVRRVALNKAVSGVRRRVNEDHALKRLAARRAPTGEVEVTDESFWAAVRCLPSRQGQAVALFYVEDRSVADIARILDLAEATVRVHLHRGRLSLANALGLDAGKETT